MIKTRRLNDPPPVPYVVKYGPRSGLRTAGPLYDREADCPMTIVDHSFLRPRPGLDLSKLQPLNPEQLKDMEHMIMHFGEEFDL